MTPRKDDETFLGTRKAETLALRTQRAKEEKGLSEVVREEPFLHMVSTRGNVAPADLNDEVEIFFSCQFLITFHFSLQQYSWSCKQVL